MALHSGIKQNPYKAMFCIKQRLGLTTSLLLHEVKTAYMMIFKKLEKNLKVEKKVKDYL